MQTRQMSDYTITRNHENKSVTVDIVNSTDENSKLTMASLNTDILLMDDDEVIKAYESIKCTEVVSTIEESKLFLERTGFEPFAIARMSLDAHEMYGIPVIVTYRVLIDVIDKSFSIKDIVSLVALINSIYKENSDKSDHDAIEIIKAEAFRILEKRGKVLENLALRDLEGSYWKMNVLDERNEVYHDKTSNNYIVFNPLDEECDTDSIANSIRPSAYEYLIDVLNNNSNVVVLWSQIEGTTSDYTIYRNVTLDYNKHYTFDKIYDVLRANVKENNAKGYKYTEVIDGIENIVNV